MSKPDYIDMVLQRDEIISAEEYLKRKESGKINPSKVSIVPPRIGSNSFGEFKVKLDVPEYRVKFATE